MKPFLLMSLLLAGAGVHASPGLELAQAEEEALAASSQVKALEAEAKAAGERESAAFSFMWPRLALDSSLRYATEIPSVKLSPAAPAVKFGDNLNYSVGLGASWTFFDSGAAYNAYKAIQAAALAKRQELEAKRREVRLKARLAYFQASLMAERVRLFEDSVNLASGQARDIELRLREGASSRIDSLSARNEVLLRRGQLRQAKSDLSAALRDLYALLGSGGENENAELDARLEGLKESLARLQGAEDKPLAKDLPLVKALELAAGAARSQARSLSAGHWPRLQAGARASYDYPNGPVLEQIQQNTVSLSASWPLFAFGQVGSQVAEQESLALASESKAASILSDLRRDWLKSRDRLRALKDQRELDRESVGETAALSKLVYSSYQNGSSSLLEAQSASLKSLEAQVRLVSTETQMLVELALISSLSE